MRHFLWLSIAGAVATPPLFAQATSMPRPIIDMHLHAYAIPPAYNRHPFWLPAGVETPATSELVMTESIAELRRHHVVKAWASGPVPVVMAWKAAAPDLILGAPDFVVETSFPSVEELRARFEAGDLEGLGELVAQLAGMTPSDPFFEPYLDLAEELDVPVGFHTGFPPPGIVYDGFPRTRASLGNPLGVEDALVRHPKLRAYIMHAGYPFLEETIAVLHAHPRLYADIAEINWLIPRAEFHEYLRRLVQSGFGNRLMYGSDQMLWPAAIGRSIEAVDAAPFLSEVQKRDIFCGNAARFLRLDPTVCGS